MKVWDYFNHVQHSSEYIAKIYFTPNSLWNESNPWLKYKGKCLKEWQPQDADALFLAGMDWLALDEELRTHSPIPIINLIQHVRHADPGDKRFQFLKNRAIRVCVSREIEDALVASGQANGPTIVIPNGIDMALLPVIIPNNMRDIDVCIVGIKNAVMARRIYWRLKFYLDRSLNFVFRRIKLVTQKISREQFLDLLNRSHVTVFLPNKKEGFYLPALEGMALKTLVICPDCEGNRGFCLPDVTCLQPQYNTGAIIASVKTALQLSDTQKTELINNAYDNAMLYKIETERSLFLDLLTNLEEKWAGKSQTGCIHE